MSDRSEALRRMRAVETMPTRWTNGCAEKQAHPSRKIAMGIKRYMLKNLRAQLDASTTYDEAENLMIAIEHMELYLSAYNCKCCGRWHLGNDTRPERTA